MDFKKQRKNENVLHQTKITPSCIIALLDCYNPWNRCKHIMISTRFNKYVMRHAHFRFKENILVFESDDWGLLRNGHVPLDKNYGALKHWTKESKESPENVEALTRTLLKYRDRTGRPPCFTANFIVREPNFEKIKQNALKSYFDSPIHDKALLQQYKQGHKQKVFFPQYHGRSHLNVSSWIDSLTSNSDEQELFHTKFFPGLQLFKGNGDRHKSEYYLINQSNDFDPIKMGNWTKIGLLDFQNLFGYKSQSTIAPHYIFNTSVEHIWKDNDIKYIQGANYHILKKENDKEIILNHFLGETNTYNQIYLSRNMIFEPAEENPKRGVEQVLKTLSYLISKKIPGIVDTHRINYSGTHSEHGLSQLNELLKRIPTEKFLFLTSQELGEAILNNGSFKDAFSHASRRLTPCNSIINKFSMKIIKKQNLSKLRKYS